MAAITGALIRDIVFYVAVAGALGWLIYITVKKADDPAKMVFRWIFTAIIVTFMVWKVAPLVGKGGYTGAFGGIPLTAVCGLALGITWRHAIGAFVAKPFASLYDGGDTPPDPHPAYSVALSKQKKGEYLDAILLARKQLERFPTDVEGQLLVAQIEAENLHDLQSAEMTIERLVTQPGHAPKNIVFALYSLADWQLKYGQNRAAAQRALERIIALLPDTEFSLGAAQRIAHLGYAEMMLSPHDRKKFVVTEGIKNVGLAKNLESLQPEEKAPSQQASELVAHLEQHPLDTDAREQLATIYADHYQRLDLAADQLEQMIQQPNQPTRLVVRWLNRLADLQIRCGTDYETVRATLQRIIDIAPNLSGATSARTRIDLLKLELRKQQQNQPVKMGTYEQNLGLKQTRQAST